MALDGVVDDESIGLVLSGLGGGGIANRALRSAVHLGDSFTDGVDGVVMRLSFGTRRIVAVRSAFES